MRVVQFTNNTKPINCTKPIIVRIQSISVTKSYLLASMYILSHKFIIFSLSKWHSFFEVLEFTSDKWPNLFQWPLSLSLSLKMGRGMLLLIVVVILVHETCIAKDITQQYCAPLPAFRVYLIVFFYTDNYVLCYLLLVLLCSKDCSWFRRLFCFLV
jgi:hypothetical protein